MMHVNQTLATLAIMIFKRAAMGFQHCAFRGQLTKAGFAFFGIGNLVMPLVSSYRNYRGLGLCHAILRRILLLSAVKT
jgi:hypothetical protein